MVLAERPRSASAHPRNVMVGHLVAVISGVVSLLLLGLWQAPSVTAAGVDAPRVIAAAMSLALTALVLQGIRAPHAPAGATTLIVSLGFMTSVSALLAICAAIGFVTAVATAMNRLTGARTRWDVDRDPTQHRPYDNGTAATATARVALRRGDHLEEAR